MTDQNDPHPVRRETCVPIPADVGTRRARYPHEKYFFGEMDVGDSRFMPGEFRELNSCPLYHAAQKYARRHAILLDCKRYPNGVRCWRVA